MLLLNGPNSGPTFFFATTGDPDSGVLAVEHLYNLTADARVGARHRATRPVRSGTEDSVKCGLGGNAWLRALTGFIIGNGAIFETLIDGIQKTTLVEGLTLFYGTDITGQPSVAWGDGPRRRLGAPDLHVSLTRQKQTQC